MYAMLALVVLLPAVVLLLYAYHGWFQPTVRVVRWLVGSSSSSLLPDEPQADSARLRVAITADAATSPLLLTGFLLGAHLVGRNQIDAQANGLTGQADPRHGQPSIGPS